MKRRKLTALIIFFAMTTAALAPTAFRLGVAHGEIREIASQNLPFNMSENGTLRPSGDSFDTNSVCENLGHPGVIQRFNGQIDCLPSGTGALFASGATRISRAQNSAVASGGPLQNAVVTAIANAKSFDQAGENASNSAATPRLALALTANNSAGISANGAASTGNSGGATTGSPVGGFAGGFAGPSIPWGSGLPGINVPGGGGLAALSENDSSFREPDLVTPVPGALPLILTGFVALYGAKRRRRSN